MQSFLAKCAALGIVAGGFTLTGDVGRLADRGRRLLEARTVPSETSSEELAADSPAPAPSAPEVAAPVQSAVRQPSGQTPAAVQPAATGTRNQASASSGFPLVDAPVGRAVDVPSPPSRGPDSIDLRQVSAGSRLLVWVRRSSVTSRARAMDLIALDLIDPASGEALEHRHAALTHGGEPDSVHAAPRRVVIARDAAGRIAKGGMLRVASVHGVVGLGREETIGTIVAIDVQPR